MGYRLGLRSLNNLRGVHPDLVAVVKKAITITTVDFTVIEGLRTQARQKQLYLKGATKTMRSRHLDGHAVDIVPYVDGKIRWDWPLFYPVADAMKAAALQVEVPVEWGGDWRSFKDGPHWQLPWRDYPA
jgi:peptidoglycan L-alanyl-D-glutamate endopeptidase CwlK